MKYELEEFAESHGLSPRETDVFALLANKVVHFKDIAAHLELSPSTVNNHLKSIFEKTDTNSKSELLAMFLKHVASKLSHCKHLARRPQVLVVDDEPGICDLVCDELTHRGMKVYGFTNPAEALRSVAGMKLDAVVSDIRMPGLDGIELLRAIRKTHHYFPSMFFISGYSRHETIDEIMDQGGVALIDKPIDMGRLFNAIMEQFIEDDQEQEEEYTRTQESMTTVIKGELRLKPSDVGFGGVFVRLESLTEGNFATGSLLSFCFRIDKQTETIHALGEVVWKREKGKVGLDPGFGVKFIHISTADRELVHRHVREKRILSFVPIGLTKTA